MPPAPTPIVQSVEKSPKPAVISQPVVQQTKSPIAEKPQIHEETKTPAKQPDTGLTSENTAERKKKGVDMMAAYTEQAKQRANPSPVFQESDESISEEISIEVPQSESEDFIF